MRPSLLSSLPAFVLVLGCGGSTPAAHTASGGSAAPPSTAASAAMPPPEEASAAVRPCGTADQVKTHDLGGTEATETLAPCAAGGGKDFSGVIRFENVPGGVRIIIHATDDEVTLLGPDATAKDAVIVYPRGAGSQAVEVPLIKTNDGWEGDKVILFSEMGDLSDGGQKVDVAIFDHDKSSGKPAEALHVSVAVSTGMSCAAAEKAYPETSGAQAPDSDKLAAPLQSNAFAQGVGACNLPRTSGAEVCAFVKGGKALGVSVKVKPANNAVAVCMDRLTRGLAFPAYTEPGEVHWKAAK